MKRILVIEDEPDLRELVEFNLKTSGYSPVGTDNANDALMLLEDAQFDLILLDLMLPGLQGGQFLKILRGMDRVSDTPVMIVSAKDSEEDIIAGLDAGADDYLTKPFGIKVLLSKIAALLRRTTSVGRENAVHAGISVNSETHRAAVDGKDIQLAAKEFELLLLFVRNPEKVFTRNQLLNTIWGYEADIFTRTVDAHISSLRKKMGEKGRLIHSVPKIGYRMES
ncbi:MAG: response regulator transcription factor [Acidobacteria bacterium]|nr:response regulator transcription factor [Acidobacteriota bacterium]